MSLSSVGAATSQTSTPGAGAGLRGRWLTLAWVGWSLLTVLSLIDFITSIHEYLIDVQRLCHPGTCVPGQPTPETAQTLHQFGLSVGAYAALAVGLVIISGVISAAVAAVIIWRKPNDWMVLLVSSTLITQGVFENNYLHGFFDNAASPWHIVGLMLAYLSPVQLLFVCAFFPNGRSVPRWVGWLLLGICLLDLPPSLFPTMPFVAVLETPFLFIGFPLIAWSMIYRYRWVSTPVERQQTKWVVFGVTLLVFAFMVWLIPQLILYSTLSQPGSLYDLVGHPLLIVAALLEPVCIGIAVLRYRLWDIDLLINRALVYGSLTALLAALYAGLIIGLESLGRLFSEQASQPVVVVISTLAIAALVRPVQKRIQVIIDRRFYRKKYDTEKTLAAFSATLQNEVDLEQMRQQLLTVVQETMQPESISLWLRHPE
jgi:hypothetical protein